MSTVTTESLLEQLRWRYATKKFDPTRKIPAEIWSKLEEAAVLAPSSYGLQPWKFVVVTDPAVRTKLSAAAFNQPQITEASHLVVFCVKKGMGAADAERLAKRTAEVRGVPVETQDGYKNLMAGAFARGTTEQNDHWMSRQVYIALGVFLASAAMLGVDACPMEGFQPPLFDEILGLSAQGYGSLVLATAGYRNPDDKYAVAPKVRYDKKEVVQHI